MEHTTDISRRPVGGLVYRALKRTFDVAFALSILVLGSPFVLATALAIRLSMGSPVLFRHVRPGLAGRPFEVLKFRTMTDARDETGELLPSTERLTGVGRLVRKLSLDELPQFINVLRGEMSIVGPRPLLVEYLDLYTPEQARRHDVRPGITGWAQVNGRSALSWEERFELDVYYVDHRSLLLDAKIVAMTAYKVVVREGATPADAEIMKRFTGSGETDS